MVTTTLFYSLIPRPQYEQILYWPGNKLNSSIDTILTPGNIVSMTRAEHKVWLTTLSYASTDLSVTYVNYVLISYLHEWTLFFPVS